MLDQLLQNQTTKTHSQELKSWWIFHKNKKEAAELDILATLVERYEEEHYPINPWSDWSN